MACLSQYRAARRRAGEHVLPEIEFNFGRAFHQLGKCRRWVLTTTCLMDQSSGLYTLAVAHYEKGLKLVEDRTGDVGHSGLLNIALV